MGRPVTRYKPSDQGAMPRLRRSGAARTRPTKSGSQNMARGSVGVRLPPRDTRAAGDEAASDTTGIRYSAMKPGSYGSI